MQVLSAKPTHFCSHHAGYTGNLRRLSRLELIVVSMVLRMDDHSGPVQVSPVGRVCPLLSKMRMPKSVAEPKDAPKHKIAKRVMYFMID